MVHRIKRNDGVLDFDSSPEYKVANPTGNNGFNMATGPQVLRVTALFCVLCLLAACSSSGPTKKVEVAAGGDLSANSKVKGHLPDDGYDIAGDYAGGGAVSDVIDQVSVKNTINHLLDQRK